MSQKPIFKRITQIGLVVKSVEATAQRCWEELGIGPWTFYTFDPAKQDSKVEDMIIRGKRVDHAMRMGHALIGDIDWEIIEPLDDRSVYAEHLRLRGEGIHHVLFDVDNYHEIKTHLKNKGYDEVVSGKWGGNPYCYFDLTSVLGCIAEFWSPPEDLQTLPPPESTYPQQLPKKSETSGKAER